MFFKLFTKTIIDIFTTICYSISMQRKSLIVIFTMLCLFTNLFSSHAFFDSHDRDNDDDIDHTTKAKYGFLTAVDRGNFAKVKQLVSQGLDINQQDKDGNTALMISSRNHNLNITKFLLANGANKLIKNQKGQTALDIATKRKHQKIIDVLSKE